MSTSAAENLDDETVYCIASGIVCCSVCAPAGMSRETIERKVNAMNPTGITSRWSISEHPTFVTGQPNPCPCEQEPDRMHYLLVC